ncbi:MAG: hypothetical protein ACLQDV_02725 [Candidatus Binataceae bacterium]
MKGTLPLWSGWILGGKWQQTLRNSTARPRPTLAPKQSCQITATFTPTGIGPARAFLMMNDNARNGPVRDSLTGTGQ